MDRANSAQSGRKYNVRKNTILILIAAKREKRFQINSVPSSALTTR